MDWISLIVGLVLGYLLGYLVSRASVSDDLVKTGQGFVNGLLHKVKSGESVDFFFSISRSCKDDDDEGDNEEPPSPCCDEDVKPEVYMESWRYN